MSKQQTSAQSTLSLDITALETMNFALVHNSVPLVRELAITNNGDTTLEDLSVGIELSHYARPWYEHIPRLAPGATHHAKEPVFNYDEDRLLNAAERDQVQLKFGVYQMYPEESEKEPSLLVSESRDVAILAYNEWRRDSEPQMLASFVLPNHPAIQTLLERAKSNLKRITGDASLGGYQAKDPSRVLAMAQGIYESLADLGITYANPPASFEETGQKIRTPEQILKNKIATCLDVSVVLAAMMEQVGLHPLLILIEGHAFPGVWLKEDYRGDGGFWDAGTVRNEIALGTLQVFDSSAAVHQPASGFQEAIATANSALQDDDEFRFAVDIRGARGMQYRPLPSRVYGSEFGTVKEVQVVAPPPTRIVAAPPRDIVIDERTTSPKDSPEIQEAKGRLRFWQKQLLDLSLRNRLLNFYPDGRHGVEILCADVPRLEDHIAAGKSFVFHPEPGVFSVGDQRSAKIRKAQTGKEVDQAYLRERLDEGVLHSSVSEEKHAQVLTKLARKGRESFEEAGAHTIYLTLGLLRWFESPSSEVERFAPTLMVPVQLIRGRGTKPWRIEASDEAPLFNPSLIEKLKADFGIDLTSLHDELPGDDAGIDVPAVFDRVRAAIRAQDRWELKEETHVGQFLFTKQIMWRDVDQLIDEVKDNPLLRSLSLKGQAGFPTGAGVPEERELDSKYPPAEVFCPMDADSSQLAAILAAANGESFVLQGPPGTGKSQTITNLITHCLTVGKTVLFVSAKMAALQVVHKRLERSGMGPFCLELHSHSARKKAVLDQMSQALHAKAESTPAWDEAASNLEADRAQLNQYVDALHRERRQGATLREGMANLCRLKAAPRIRLELGSPTQLTRRNYRERAQRLDEFVAIAKRVGTPGKSAFAASTHTSWTPGLQDSFERALEDALSSLASVAQASSALESLLGESLSRSSLAELILLSEALHSLSDGAPVLPALMTAAAPAEASAQALTFIELGKERDTLKLQLESAYSDSFYHLNLEELEEKLRAWVSAFFLLAWFMLWSTRSALKSVRKSSAVPANADLLSDVVNARALKRMDRRFEEQKPEARRLLPSAAAGCDWQELRVQAERSLTLRSQLDKLDAADSFSSAMATKLRSWAPSGRESGAESERSRILESASTFRQGLNRLTQRLEIFASCINLDAKRAWSGDSTPLAPLQNVLSRMQQSSASFRDWTRYQMSRESFASTPEARLIAALEASELALSDLPDAFERAFDQTWVDYEYSSETVLANFDGALHEQLVERFQERDSSFAQLAIRKAQSSLAAQIPRGRDGEMATLHRELKKQRAHMPIRKLFREVPTVRRRLKPCLLMSPLSVAQYLQPTERFDIVIFDEASQLPTADSIGAIARGKQLVVVGDSKQLPPTAFFSQSSLDEDASDEPANDEMESILDECIASRMQELSLRWHYRSQHEHLIAFSNHYYYDNTLNTFAQADDRGSRLGVKLVPVPSGHYEKGKSRTNRGEAEAVVNEVIRRLNDPEEQKRSLGIVTFSMAQQRLVEDLLDGHRAKDTALERFFSERVNEPVFIKNLENVQGDERDVILFSICYGPDATGKVSMNFGPLNKQGGERRLNVAVTRARQQLIVFSTLRADQIDLRRTRATGVKHLRSFLQYAARGPKAIAEAVSIGGEVTFDSAFEEQLYAELEKRGYSIATQVGCSGYRIDLAVVDPERPGRFILGIECDGSAYHSARAARDRDRLRQQVLESLGWKLHRIWSTDWWTEPEAVMKTLEAAIANSFSQDSQVSLLGANQRGTEEHDESLALNTTDNQATGGSGHGGITPPPAPVLEVGDIYQPTELAEASTCFEFDTVEALPELCADLECIIAAESPVHLRIVATRLAPKWGITRITQRVIRQLSQAIQTNRLGFLYEDILWKDTEQRLSFDCVRRPSSDPASERKLEDIPSEELLAAGRIVLAHSLSVERDEFKRAVARLFGIQRAGSKVMQILDDIVARLLADGHAVESGANIALPS